MNLFNDFILNAGFISTGSVGNSRSSTQMNSYSDSGYQEISSFHNSQNLNKSELRQQHSLGGAPSNHVGRSSRAEGQTSVQVLRAVHCAPLAGVNVTKSALFDTFTGDKAGMACSRDSSAGINTGDSTMHWCYPIRKVSLTQIHCEMGQNLPRS